MSFAALKKNRKKNLDKLATAAAETSQGNKKNYNDDRLWKPTRDKAGNGYAVIRFLPAPEGNPTPWTEYYDHGFKGPTGQWYIEKSLTTIGQDDPVGEYNSKLWNSVDRDDTPERQQARDQKRRRNFVANIMVISDSANPENNGKVFLYKFGKKIFDKIMDAMQPQFEDEDPINPFDFWEGADFKLKIRTPEGGWPNYDKSEFADVSALRDDDEELEEIYGKLYDLSEFTDPSTFKSYDELKAKLERVLGLTDGTNRQPTLAEQAQLGDEEEAPSAGKEEAPAMDPVSSDGDDDDESMSYFSKLAAED